MFSLTPASSQWQVLETILGLKIPGLKTPALEICSLLQAGKQALKSRMGILLAELLLLCCDQRVGLDYWHGFPSPSLPTSSKSPQCPAGVCTDLLHDLLAHTGQAAMSLCGLLCLSYVTWVFRSYCSCAAIHEDVSSDVFINCFPTMSL